MLPRQMVGWFPRGSFLVFVASIFADLLWYKVGQTQRKERFTKPGWTTSAMTYGPFM